MGQEHKLLIVLRALPGAGKSTLAQKLQQDLGPAVVCSADDFLYNGEKILANYLWTPERAQAAHKSCMEKFDQALSENKFIILDNTNIRVRDFSPYVAKAVERGYEVKVHAIVGWSAMESFKSNQHNVPYSECLKKFNNFKPLPGFLEKKGKKLEVTEIVHSAHDIRKGLYETGLWE